MTTPGGESDIQAEADELLERGYAQAGDGDTEAALATFDEIVRRWSEETEPGLRIVVGQALCACTHLLEAPDDRARLDRVMDFLISRGDEAIDDEIADFVAWALGERVTEHLDHGRREEALLTLEDIHGRFHGHSGPDIQDRVRWALATRANLLRDMGRGVEARAASEALLSSSEALLDPWLRGSVIWGLCAEATSDAAGTPCRLVAYDDILARLAELDDPRSDVAAAEVLLAKGSDLLNAERRAEAVVAFDGVVARYPAADDRIEMLPTVALAHDYLARTLAELGRADEVLDVADGLRRLLGEADLPARSIEREVYSTWESDLARTFARAMDVETWDVPGVGSDDERSAVIESRAIELVREVIEAIPATGMSERPLGAMLMVFALAGARLARRGGAVPPGADVHSLPQQVAAIGMADWAAELGHPVAGEASEEIRDRQPPETPAAVEPTVVRDLGLWLLSVLASRDIRFALASSVVARETPVDRERSSFARWQVDYSVRLAGWVGPRPAPVAGATAAVALLVAWGNLVAAASPPSPAIDAFPSDELLRSLLDQDELREQLEEALGVLPTWLT
jgi:tetratricopeptide (TPR) repeat protein